MTEKTFDSMVDAVNKGEMLDWLYDNHDKLSKDELAQIARELYWAMEQPLKFYWATEQPLSDEDSHSREERRKTFLDNMSDHYDTFGFDDEDEDEEPAPQPQTYQNQLPF